MIAEEIPTTTDASTATITATGSGCPSQYFITAHIATWNAPYAVPTPVMRERKKTFIARGTPAEVAMPTTLTRSGKRLPMVDVDTVVIGSGMGGLTAAVALAQAGQKVLVLEQHYAPGGWTHSFALDGFRFSPGVHYLGQLQEGGHMRATFEGLGLGEFLSFFEINPDGYDHVRAGDITFDFCAGKDALLERFCSRFPNERKGITEYLTLAKTIRDELGELANTRGFIQTLTVPYRTRHMGRYGMYSLSRILNDRIKDPTVRGLLSVQCGDHGLPPSRAPFAMHATVALHYLEGAWYPKGGGSALPKAFTRALTRAGSAIKLEARVEKIIIENKRAIGVKLADGTEIRCNHVVSNADPSITYGRLMDPEDVPGGITKKIAKTKWSTTAVSLFFAVEADVKALGLDSGNYWLCPGLDADAAYTAMAKPDVLELDELPGVFVSVTSLKDPLSFNGKHHTCEAFTFVPYEIFHKYANGTSGAHGEEYEAFKRKIAGKMLAAIEKRIPGLTKKVVFQNLGSPLTNVHYVEATRGNIYGTEKVLNQMGPFGFKQRSPIKGLTLCGASTLGHGVPGAAMSGLNAAALMLDCPQSALLKKDQPKLQTFSSDRWKAPARRNEIVSTTPGGSDYPAAQP